MRHPERPPAVLLVEDEETIARFIRTALEDQGFRVAQAASGAAALRLAEADPPDVVLLDLGLPDMGGLDVLRRLRSWSAVPVIIISARGQEAEKIAGLDGGADDYLTKPFSIPELLARVRVATRHAERLHAREQVAVFASGGLRVDLAARRVWTGAGEVQLSPVRFDVLAVLVRNAGRVVTHRQLLREVWPGSDAGPESVRIYVHQLRHLLEANPARPRYLKTEPGVGYRLVVDEDRPEREESGARP